MSDKENELTRIRRELERQHDLVERQADALERVAEQLEIQNGVLLQAASEIYALRRAEFGQDPGDFSMDGYAGHVEDNILRIAERVDRDRARRYADE